MPDRLSPKELAAAIAWHRTGMATAPTAKSVVYTGTILAELDEAVALLRAYATVHGANPDVNRFLAKYHEAPDTVP
jgi:hypothetical protein